MDAHTYTHLPVGLDPALALLEEGGCSLACWENKEEPGRELKEAMSITSLIRPRRMTYLDAQVWIQLPDPRRLREGRLRLEGRQDPHVELPEERRGGRACKLLGLFPVLRVRGVEARVLPQVERLVRRLMWWMGGGGGEFESQTC